MKLRENANASTYAYVNENKTHEMGMKLKKKALSNKSYINNDWATSDQSNFSL